MRTARTLCYMPSWYVQGPLYLPTAGTFSVWVPVVTAKLTQKVFCCLTAVVKLWQAAGVPGAVCRVEVDSQFDKYVVRSQVHSLWTDLLCQHFHFGVKLSAAQFCKLANNRVANLRLFYPYLFSWSSLQYTLWLLFSLLSFTIYFWQFELFFNVVNATTRPLHPRERHPVPFVQEAGWTPRPVWTVAEILDSTAIRSPDRPSRS